MRYIFIDETSDSNNKNYLGVCIVQIDSTKYSSIKKEFWNIIRKFNWDPSIEFKGSWIFSASKGCSTVPVADRVSLATKIISMNRSDKNARIHASYISSMEGNNDDVYYALVKLNLNKLLQKAPKGLGKNLVSIYCDERSSLSPSIIRDLVKNSFDRKGYVIVEDPVIAKSNLHTVGVCIADIIGYLVSRVDNIHVDADLLKDVNKEAARKNMQLKKYLTSSVLIDSIKKMEAYKAVKKK
ncbi:MAG: DUF3800 domain-containing protein [bacterium]|nr:DUF3800 domain-containing protein [bacterium]